jgi:hypothetical protein
MLSVICSNALPNQATSNERTVSGEAMTNPPYGQQTLCTHIPPASDSSGLFVTYLSATNTPISHTYDNPLPSHDLSTTHPCAKMFDEMRHSLSTASALPVPSYGVLHMRCSQHSHQYVL